jgi:hypothetical protein
MAQHASSPLHTPAEGCVQALTHIRGHKLAQHTRQPGHRAETVVLYTGGAVGYQLQ